MFRTPYYATRDRNGTEDEITLFGPDARRMLCVAFWDEPDISSSAQLKVDASLIVAALNLHHRLTAPKRWFLSRARRRPAIVIEVRGGVVQDVLNLPPGVQFEIRDYDDLDCRFD